MDRILRGVHHFHTKIFPEQQQFFRTLADKQQNPQALFITCSDSRMNPNLITQTEPGDLFLLRNAGNLVPPYGITQGGESATIEYAVAVLGIRHIIICGHSHCGAMKALLQPESVRDLPAVAQWFTYAEATRRIAKERYGHLTGDAFERAIIEENVLVQLNHLNTHPYVMSRVASGEVRLYGWCYEIETGLIYEYNQEVGRFLPVSLVPHPAMPLNIRYCNHEEAPPTSLDDSLQPAQNVSTVS
jgi:carbonic anhydrase